MGGVLAATHYCSRSVISYTHSKFLLEETEPRDAVSNCKFAQTHLGRVSHCSETDKPNSQHDRQDRVYSIPIYMVDIPTTQSRITSVSCTSFHDSNSGIGDFGVDGIKTFIRDHQCGDICLRLGLDKSITLGDQHGASASDSNVGGSDGESDGNDH